MMPNCATPADSRDGTRPMTDFDAIFKAYDVRGTVPDQFTADGPRRSAVPSPASLPARARPRWSWVTTCARRRGVLPAFGDGALEHGVDVIDVGLCATDMLYYASGVLDMPGAVFTASHNPAGYNGIKMCLGGAPRSLATPASTPSRQWRSQAQIRRAAPVLAPSSTCCRAMSTMSARSSTCRR